MLGRLRQVSPRAWDVLLVAALVVGTAGEEAARDAPWTPAQAAADVLRVAAAVSLVWRRRGPVPVAMLCCATMPVSAVLTAGVQESLSVVVVIFVAVYSAVVHARTWVLGLAVVGWFTAATTLASVADYGDPLGGLTVSVVYSAMVLGFAATVRQARERSVAEGLRADAEEELGARRARDAVTAERTRIARELHDIVAHALSIAVLQARGGRKVLHRDTEAAGEALATIESTAEQALVEMRRLVGLLRDDPSDLVPQPSLRTCTLSSRSASRLACEPTSTSEAT